MKASKHFLSKWKNEYDFKTYIAAGGSLFVTLIFALYNGFLGIYHESLWHGTICVYYILLSGLRGSIIIAAKKLAKREAQEAERNKASFKISFLLLILNISLIVPISIMVRQQKPVSLTLVPAIAMAAYTTYKIAVASVNLKKRKKSSDSLVWILRTIGFIDALVSLLTLQNTLVMVKSDGDYRNMLPLTGFTSAVVWGAVVIMSFGVRAKGFKRIKNR